ncbi:hypothetical protein [Dankookia sp. P2]|uniref:hypothetical protein n=1 Tax=Dankookia sp. P2 TaxID=3423955 RepID=UPI003D67A0F5
MDYRPVVFEQNDEARRSYLAGRCDAYSTDASQLAGLRSSFPNPEEHVILPDIISKEPHAPVVRHGDDQWFDIVRWTFFALLTAEELGITQANVDEQRSGQNPEVRRLLGLTGDHGPLMGLDRAWAYNAIKAVGDYGEVFERNLGMGSAVKLPRGLNDLWSRGGADVRAAGALSRAGHPSWSMNPSSGTRSRCGPGVGGNSQAGRDEDGSAPVAPGRNRAGRRRRWRRPDKGRRSRRGSGVTAIMAARIAMPRVMRLLPYRSRGGLRK